MTDIHPTLEAVARAICALEHTEIDLLWNNHLDRARAALIGFANAWDDTHGCFTDITTNQIREIAAEPKTVEDVLREHRAPNYGPPGTMACPYPCGWFGPTHKHAAHVAEKLREAGLVNE